MLVAGIIVVCLFGGGAILLQSNSFGKNPDKYAVEAFKAADNYDSTEQTFVNTVPTTIDFSTGDFMKATKAYISHKDSIPRKPKKDLPVESTAWQQQDDSLWFSWMGHSSIYLNIDQLKIWIDPVFSKRCSPFQWAGNKRFHPFPHDTAEVKAVDIVVISHDHYDHLDMHTIKALKNTAGLFIVPLGVGSHLQKWGIDEAKIVELNWWESHDVNDLKIVCTPARHFSGRRIKNQNQTLWASWTFIGSKQRVFYSGDTGYFEGFKTIGEKYGPFDFTFIQTGAYDSLWADIHMFPEEAIQTHKDLRGDVMIPVHWGTFNLALHSWNEPVNRLIKIANNNKAKVIYPRLNQQVFAHEIKDSVAFQPYWFEAENLSR